MGGHEAKDDHYRIYADGFARRSDAALIFDQRGNGESTGSREGATLADYAADALAGVRLLAKQPQISPAQVGLRGMSRGARVAASVPREVGFVIVVSAPGMSPNTLELWRLDREYREAGYPRRVADIGLK